MTRSQLIKWSIARDALNFIGIGQIPGLCWLLDLPLIVMHFRYAGPASLFTLLETIPVIGFVPFFTIAALCYPEDHDHGSGGQRLMPAVERVAVRRVPQNGEFAGIESWTTATFQPEVADVA